MNWVGTGNEGLFLLPPLLFQKQTEVPTFVRKLNDDLKVVTNEKGEAVGEVVTMIY
jgi:hypothetical protein